MMRAHLVQFDIAWEDKAQNHCVVRRLLDRAAVAPGDLVLLPEMFDTGFSLDVETTHDRDGVSRRFMAELARERAAFVQGGWTELGDDAMGRNHATTFGPDGTIACDYVKIHPFSYGREPERFVGGAGGSDGVTTWEWSAGAQRLAVCPAVCYDLRFPELFRLGLLAGAEAMAIGANWPAARQAHWSALLRARAIENQSYVMGVNRVGNDPHLLYVGGSVVFDPRGDVVGELTDEQAVLSATIAPAAVHQWRETFPAWRDVRLIGRGDSPQRSQRTQWKNKSFNAKDS